MIGGVNGFNANTNLDFSGARGQNLKAREEKEAANLMSNLTVQINYDTVNPSELDYNQLKIWADKVDPEKLTGKNLSMWLGVKMGFKKTVDDWRKELGLKPDEPVFARRIFSLSGYTRDDKISIWGKLNGLDPSVSKEQAAELKSFVDSTQALIAHAGDPSDIFRQDVFSVDKFLSKFNVDLGGFGPGLGMRSGSGLIMDAKASKLLDSDMSEEEFKDKWLEYAANKILGEYANVKISLKDGALNFDQTPAKERITLLGQDLETRVSYADEASKKEFFKFLKDVFKNGESIGDALQKIALKKGDFDKTVKEEAQADAAKEKKFKPIKATSKSQTYVYRDIKREFFENFIKAEQEKGTDVTRLLEALNKIRKLDINA
ncbi:hypothetical protein H7R39_05880 [Campylobacter sp. Marseille-Q3452]|uniref:Uncharacterized protein n=1 Tax=Campylobacter massiliensis TaxID=2762557 RepID=A0A842J7N9_9BACT|nr:hypothetical protein [Campylobacter massiliensis]MBC2882790.1 hypothetical protein [Campylobacter massiliensis]